MVVGYEKTEKLTAQQKLIAGVVSGVATRFITQPLDIVKVRTQLLPKDKRSSWLKLSWRILREEGFTTFWHGHSLGQIHSILSVASQFYAYDISTKMVEIYVPSTVTFKQVLLFMCGMFAGCSSAALVSPLEVIRVRQMILKAQYGGIWHGARTVYKSGGLRAFYEGLPASLMQMGPQVGITFAVFRFTQPLVLKYLEPATENDDGIAHKVNKKDLLISSTIAASFAGFVSKSLTYPFDLAKRRLQISSHKPSADVKTPTTSQNLVKCDTLVACLVDMVRKEGFAGLFTGWGITIYKAQLASVVAFTTYEMMCTTLRERIY